jgi:hypothetical protein
VGSPSCVRASAALVLASSFIAPLAAAEDLPRGAWSAVLERQNGGPSGCPDRETLERAVERRLGRPIFDRGPPDLIFEVRFEASTGTPGFGAHVLVRDGNGRPLGERVLSSSAATCGELASSVALVLALLADSPPVPEQPAEAPEGNAAEKPSKPPLQPPPSPTVLPQARPPAAAEAWRYAASVTAFVTSGWPTWFPALRAGFGVEPPGFWELWLVAQLVPSADVEIESGGSGAHLSAAGLGLFVCPLTTPVQDWDELGAFACLGARFDRVRAEGFGFAEDASGTAAGSEVELRLGTSQLIGGPLRLRMSLGASAALARPELRYTRPDGGEGVLYRPDLFAVDGELGLGLVFP